MPNLKIAYNSIAPNCTRILTQDTLTLATVTTLDAFSSPWDLVGGRKYYRTKLATAGPASYFLFDLGTDFASKPNQAEYFIISRPELADIAGATGTLYASTDGNIWSNKGAVSTKAGPRLTDVYTTFALTSAYRYWCIRCEISGTSLFQLSKAYFGQFFTFDFDCDYSFEKVPLSKSVWYSSAGSQYFTRSDEPLYKFHFVWNHQSDATVYAFEQKIVSPKRDYPVYLYTTAEHQILDNCGLVFASLTNYKVEKQWNNLNTITADFEEELG